MSALQQPMLKMAPIILTCNSLIVKPDLITEAGCLLSLCKTKFYKIIIHDHAQADQLFEMNVSPNVREKLTCL